LVARRAVAAYPLAAMTEPTHFAAAAPADRRQPMWPWLLFPLVALTFFLVLSRLKASDTPVSGAHHVDAIEDSAPSDDAGSN